MIVPEFLQLPDPVPSIDDAISNNGYYPNLSQAEFEKNYQVTDVFAGKTKYLLTAAMTIANNDIDKKKDTVVLPTELNTTYRMCVYAKAMMMICDTQTSVDTKTKSEFNSESKERIALVYANEYRRLLFALSGVTSETNCALI